MFSFVQILGIVHLLYTIKTNKCLHWFEIKINELNLILFEFKTNGVFFSLKVLRAHLLPLTNVGLNKSGSW